MQINPNGGLVDPALIGSNSDLIPIPPSGGYEIMSIGGGLYTSRLVDGRTVIVDEAGNILSIE